MQFFFHKFYKSHTHKDIERVIINYNFVGLYQLVKLPHYMYGGVGV
jgi:hypothetical protein